MRDTRLITGTISPATKATRVYSEDVLDMGVASSLGNVNGLFACFQLGKNVTSGDTFTFEIYESTDNSTFTLAVAGPAIDDGDAGDIITVPVPQTVARYLKLAVYPASSGTLTAQDIESWFEFT